MQDDLCARGLGVGPAEAQRRECLCGVGDTTGNLTLESILKKKREKLSGVRKERSFRQWEQYVESTWERETM